MGVHVAHQHVMAVVLQQLADIGELAGTGPRAEGQVHHHHRQRVPAFAEAHEDRAATGRAGQRVVFQGSGLQAAEQAVAVLGNAPEVAIELLVPVGEGTELGQVLDLVDVAGADAATIGFLQGHHVIVVEQFADALQVAGTPGGRQQVLPAAGQVVTVPFGTDAHLDVETEQA